MRRLYLTLVFVSIFLVGTIIAYHEHQTTPNAQNSETPIEPCFVQEYFGDLKGITPVAEFGDVKIYSTENGYVIDNGKSRRFLNADNAFFFDWGFIVVRNTTTKMTVPLVLYQIDANSVVNISVRSVTSDVLVKVLTGCTYDGKPLWNLTFSGYAWAYDGGKYGVKANGTALPALLVTNTSDYLYVLVYQTSPRQFSNLRRYAPDDYFYIIGENGTVRKFDLGGGAVPIRNTFLVSNGSYVLMGFEKPQLDGSPSVGQVMILNGTEVIFQRLFRMNDPTCLCHIIPGWGRIDKKGCAVFGLYTGEGRYCNGEFTYMEDSTGES